MAKTKNLGWPLGRREAEPEVQRWTFNNGVKRTCWDIIQTCASYFPGQRSKYSFIIENIQFRIYKTFGSEKELIKITILRDVQKEIVNEKNSVQKTNQKSHGIAQIWRYKVALPFRNLKKKIAFFLFFAWHFQRITISDTNLNTVIQCSLSKQYYMRLIIMQLICIPNLLMKFTMKKICVCWQQQRCRRQTPKWQADKRYGKWYIERRCFCVS
jgi:hypothetical protein